MRKKIARSFFLAMGTAICIFMWVLFLGSAEAKIECYKTGDVLKIPSLY